MSDLTFASSYNSPTFAEMDFKSFLSDSSSFPLKRISSILGLVTTLKTRATSLFLEETGSLKTLTSLMEPVSMRFRIDLSIDDVL